MLLAARKIFLRPVRGGFPLEFRARAIASEWGENGGKAFDSSVEKPLSCGSKDGTRYHRTKSMKTKLFSFGIDVIAGVIFFCVVVLKTPKNVNAMEAG